MLAYIASDNQIMVQMHDRSTLIFDQDGYICHSKVPELLKQPGNKVIKQSIMT